MLSPVEKPPGISWLAIAVLTLVFLVRGVIHICVLPPFEAWDEFQHLGYIDHLSQHATNPVFGETMLDAEFSRAVARFPQPRGDSLNVLTPYGAAGYDNYWKQGANVPFPDYPLVPLYEAQHPPLYYWLMVPVYRLCGGRANVGLALSALRALNLGFAALAILCILWWICRNLPPLAGLFAGLYLCLQPLVLQDLTRVANDPLAFLLGTIVICACLSLRRPNFWRLCLLIALALPLGTLAKAIDLTLLPVVFGGIFLCVWRRDVTWKQALGGMALILGVFLMITGPYFSFNLKHFGLLTPMQEAVFNKQAHRSFLTVIQAFPKFRAPQLTWTWWVKSDLWISGWSFLQVNNGFYRAHAWLVGTLLAAVPVALALKFSRRRWPMELRHLLMILLVLISVTAGLFYHAIAVYSAFNKAFGTPSWYTVIGQPWLLILPVCGIVALIPRKIFATLLLLLLPALYLATEIYGLLYKMIPFYGRAGISWESMRRLATLQPQWLGIPTMLGAQILLAGLVIWVLGLVIAEARKPALGGRSEFAPSLAGTIAT